MANILDYINYFTSLILGQDLLLDVPSTISGLQSTFLNLSETDISAVIARILGSPQLVFSTVVWSLFAFLTIELLLVMPYKFVKRVVRKCRIS